MVAEKQLRTISEQFQSPLYQQTVQVIARKASQELMLASGSKLVKREQQSGFPPHLSAERAALKGAFDEARANHFNLLPLILSSLIM